MTNVEKLLTSIAASALIGLSLPASAISAPFWTDSQKKQCLSILKECAERKDADLKEDFPLSRLCLNIGVPGSQQEGRKSIYEDAKTGGACDLIVTSLEDLIPKDYKPEKDRILPFLASSPARINNKDTAGTTVQSDAVAGTNPVPLVGSAIALTGSKQGSDALAVVSVNPWSLFVDPNNGGETTALEAQRLTDISVIVPLSGLGTNNMSVQGVGVRARVNLASYLGDRFAVLKDSYRSYVDAATALIVRLRKILSSTKDIRKCTESLLSRNAAGCEDSTGRSQVPDVLLVEQVEETRNARLLALARARRAADTFYFGLDLRGDIGDMTGDTVENDNGYSLNAGLAFGHQVIGWKAGTGGLQLRLRGAIDYQYFSDTPEALKPSGIVSGEWGAGFQIDWTLPPGQVESKKWLGVGLGIEGEHTSDSMIQGEKQTGFEDSETILNADAQYIDMRLVIVVPVTNGSGVNISLTKSLWIGDYSTHQKDVFFAVSGDWGLLPGLH